MCMFPRVRNNRARKTQSKSAKAMSSMSKSVGCRDEPGVKSCETSPEGCSFCEPTVCCVGDDVSFKKDMDRYNDYDRSAQPRYALKRFSSTWRPAIKSSLWRCGHYLPVFVCRWRLAISLALGKNRSPVERRQYIH